ncbi:MAG TPA: glycosyltransferase family 87 protein [Polyangiaceae bacterium]|nr:glycosyltransferase family 87 protein [Polyangiaceae bacterium]
MAGLVRVSSRRVAYVALAVAVVVSLAELVAPAWDAEAFDLSALAVGGEVVRETGFEHLYEHDPSDFNVAASEAYIRAARAVGFVGEPTPFVYAPVIAFAARPLTFVPYRWAARMWCIASVVFVVLGLVLGANHFAPGFSRKPWALVLLSLALVAFEPIRYALWLGQTTPFVFFCVMVSFAIAARRPRLAGVALAIAAFVKMTPVLFVVPWLLQKRNRACAAFVSAFAAFALASVAIAGIAPNVQFARRLFDIADETLVSFNNLGLPALLERACRPAPDLMTWKVVHLPDGTRVVVLIATVAMALVAWLGLRGVDDAAREPLAQAVATAVMLLAPSISWTHYWLFFVPPLVGCTWMVYRAGHRAVGVGISVLALALCSRPFVIDHIDHHRSAVTVIVGPTLAAGLLYVLAFTAARLLATASRSVRGPAQQTGALT